MKKNFILKILIAGDAAVGKTSLLLRYVEDRFDERMTMTLGVDFFLKQVHFIDTDVKCLLQFWDLGGQQRFRHLMTSYIAGSRAALLLIDLTRPPEINSFLQWLNIVRLHDINLPIVLVGTKEDLKDVIVVEDELAIKIKETFNLVHYIKTSAKTGYNVNEVFEFIAKFLIKSG
jgi:small GTP-binding protein